MTMQVGVVGLCVCVCCVCVRLGVDGDGAHLRVVDLAGAC
jgi:hypothetical protein